VLNISLASFGLVKAGSAAPPTAAPTVPVSLAALDSSDCIPSKTRPFPALTIAVQ